MNHEPQIQLRTAQLDGLSGAVDEAFPELFGWLAKHAIAVAGAPFIRYLVIDMQADFPRPSRRREAGGRSR